MTPYEVGSVASFVSQKAPQQNKKKKLQKNQEVLNQLFALPNDAVNTVVTNVPISTENVPKKKKKQRQTDDYAISSTPNLNKKEDFEHLDEEEAEKLLDYDGIDNGSDSDEDDKEAEKVSKKMKKTEIKNVKKNLEKKGTLSEDADRVIHVKNLPVNAKRKSIHHFFAKYGKIEAVWLRCAPLASPAIPKKVAMIKQEFHPEGKSISAFVRFETSEAAQQALEATGSEFQERHIAVSLLCQSQTKKDSGLAIFVGNVPFNISDEDLWLHFADCGKIVDVRVIRDRDTSIGKGFAYVNFENSDSVELALKLDESTLNGRAIRVTRCKRNPKPFKPEVKDKKGNKDGAYRRIKNKEGQKERKKGSGWVSKMRQNKKSLNEKKGTAHSFSGEMAGASAQKTVKTAKVIKINKGEQKKKLIAAKLAAVNKKK